MTILIILLASLIALAGLLLLIKPAIVIGILESNYESAWIHVVAISVRIALGLLLIAQSSVSRYPTIIEILGGVSLFAAAFLLVIGRKRFQRMVMRVIAVVKPYSRLGGLLSFAFGAFLVYAFI